jgi:hypothetical protein
VESLLVEEEVLSHQTGISAEKGHNFWSDSCNELKVLQYFPKPVFLEVPMESLLVEEEVLLRQTGITAEMCYNFRSDRWMDLNVLHLFP